jgi:hypothetical protein
MTLKGQNAEYELSCSLYSLTKSTIIIIARTVISERAKRRVSINSTRLYNLETSFRVEKMIQLRWLDRATVFNIKNKI